MSQTDTAALVKSLVPTTRGSDVLLRPLDARRDAADNLRSMGPAGAPYAEALAGRMDDRNPDWQRKSASVLEWMGKEGALALARKLSHRDYLVRRSAMEGLAAMSDDGAAALSAALGGDLAGGPENGARECAAQALSWMGPRGRRVLIDRCEDPRPEVRLAAVRGLGHTARESTSRGSSAPAARDSTPRGAPTPATSPRLFGEGVEHLSALARRLQDTEPGVRSAAADVLQSSGADGAAALGRAFQATSAPSQAFADQALRGMGSDGAETLAEVLRSRDANARRRAAAALQSMGQAAAKALVPRLADDCAGVRRRAAETLEQLLSGGGLGLEEVHAAAEALEKRIDDPDHWVRAASARALERGLLVDSAPLEADHRERLATAMAGRVQDRSRPVRRSVARALASRGTRQSADAAAVDAT